jgi:hypothetical protein
MKLEKDDSAVAMSSHEQGGAQSSVERASPVLGAEARSIFLSELSSCAGNPDLELEALMRYMIIVASRTDMPAEGVLVYCQKHFPTLIGSMKKV